MDFRLDPFSLQLPWCGVGRALTCEALTLVAHGQNVMWSGPALHPDRKVAIYDALVTQVEAQYVLLAQDTTQLLYIPEDDQIDFFAYKEVTCGIGGIGMGAQHLGLRCVAMMDINMMVCDTLRANGVPNVIQGDVLQAMNRCKLHECHDQLRGWVFSGFPCQPLSVQGDIRGCHDERAAVFYGVLKAAWEQQAGGVLLECVPGALQANYIQAELQKFCWSLGMELYQTVLHLHATWPCRRSRWWAMMVPRKYPVHSLALLPDPDPHPLLHHVFDRWPVWPDVEEDMLYLTDTELSVMDNPVYGSDIRHLRMNQVVPCLLHSYGSALQACPCGCRGPFSRVRLVRDGVRGFYVMGKNGRPRFLHVQEAAYLCSLRPSMTFPYGPRASLCLVGQCAAPIQALWVLSHFFDACQLNIHGGREQALLQYKEILFREAHAHFCFETGSFVTKIYTVGEQNPLTLKVAPGQTVSDLHLAEALLQPVGTSLQLWDGWGRMHSDHQLQQAPLMGGYVMCAFRKRQAKPLPQLPVRIAFIVEVESDLDIKEGWFAAGTFLFEAAAQLGLPRLHHRLSDDLGRPLQLDQRIWHHVTVASLEVLAAEGDFMQSIPHRGLTDLCLDVVASLMIHAAQKTQTHFWMPSALASIWFHHQDLHAELAHWALAALHGHLFLAVAWDRHWILLECFLHQGVLQVHYWDGQEHRNDPKVLQFASYLGNLLAVTPSCVTRRQIFSQLCCHTCGTLALLHLGHCLGLWTNSDPPDELRWHAHLLQWLPAGLLVADGKGASPDERDLIWPLRDLLKNHGVPDDRTEERARAALDRLGANRIHDALHSKSPWQALKALGSQPRHQFLFVKPDELEKQIRLRAQSRFKVSPSDKKHKNARHKVEASDIDPAHLQLIPGTFEIQSSNVDLTQLPMAEVAAHRGGIAFGRVLDVLPFLRESKSLSLDALAVLTTSRVAPVYQGLLPVLNLRFPALYLPTQEPILLEGSLVNLGDQTVLRRHEEEVITTTAIDTAVLKLTQYKDEWDADWDDIVKAPLKTILQKHPLFTLCNGQKCGGNCPRYHAPVDTEVDSVILDVWARSWLNLRGKKVTPEMAEIFQVLLRVPDTLVRPLQKLSGVSGLYVEPRLASGRGSDSSLTVIWLSNGGLADAQHKLKMAERGLAVARFAHRYGIRVPCKDAEALHVQIHPEVPYHNFDVVKTFELRPLPHGTQKLGVLNMLKAWGWKARPLQPCKPDATGMGWIVGAAEDPPKMLMTTSTGDVVISLQKTHGEEDISTTLTSSAKTQGFLRKQQRQDKTLPRDAKQSTSSAPPGLAAPSGSGDPWQFYDPWSGGRPVKPPQPMEDEPMHAKLMVDTMEERLTATITEQTEARFQKLEVDMAEIKHQHQRHERWFQDAAVAVANQNLQSQVGTLTTQVAQQQQEVSTLSQDIRSGFQNLEALFAKKQRRDE